MQMAKLTAAQKRELKRLHQSRTGIVVQHYGIQLMQVYGGLQAKGLVDNQMYHDQTRFTLTESGLTLAASLFGSSEPTPPVTPSPTPSGEPEPVAGESVADSRDTSSDTAISNSAVPVTALTDDMLTASRDQWNERTEALIADSELPFASFDKPSFQWTHNANEMPRPVATDWRSCHQAAWLFAERETVTGHGRTSRNSANKGQKRDEMRIVAQIPNMQRLKAFKPFSVENTAMPIAPLTIVPKVTKAALTRWLETRNRRAA
jgi:hypothetical protein